MNLSHILSISLIIQSSACFGMKQEIVEVKALTFEECKNYFPTSKSSLSPEVLAECNKKFAQRYENLQHQRAMKERIQKLAHVNIENERLLQEIKEIEQEIKKLSKVKETFEAKQKVMVAKTPQSRPAQKKMNLTQMSHAQLQLTGQRILQKKYKVKNKKNLLDCLHDLFCLSWYRPPSNTQETDFHIDKKTHCLFGAVKKGTLDGMYSFHYCTEELIIKNEPYNRSITKEACCSSECNLDSSKSSETSSDEDFSDELVQDFFKVATESGSSS